jgi:hypothetical protein
MRDPATCSLLNQSVGVTVAAAISLAASTANADPVRVCVSTAVELQAALSQFSDAGILNGTDALIEVVAGTYTIGTATSGGPFHYLNTASTGELTIQGGYAAGCGTRSANALATVLDGASVSQVMSLEDAHAKIDVSGLTIQNGNSSAAGAGLEVNFMGRDVAAARIFDNVIRNNHSSQFAGGLAVATSGATVVIVYSNLIVDNSAPLVGGVYVFANNSSSEGVLYDDTVSGNSATAMNGVGGADCNGTGTCEVFNSIFWGNSNFGLSLNSPGAYLSSNDIDTRNGSAIVTDVNNLSKIPDFVDSAHGDFHLASTSPLFAVSSGPFGDVDIEGHAYPTRGLHDLGVYAQTIFSYGFDPLPPE